MTEAWFEGQINFDPDRVVFLDETATASNMERRYGRAPQGEHAASPCLTVTTRSPQSRLTLRANGPIAVHLMDGPQAARFLSYVTDILMPAFTPGDAVVMDNLAAHKVAGVRQAIEAAGSHLRYLPAYNPDFNPIEQAFAKLKAILRTAAARTVPDLWAAIRDLFTRFKPDECRNYFAAAGYDASDPERTAAALSNLTRESSMVKNRLKKSC